MAAALGQRSFQRRFFTEKLFSSLSLLNRSFIDSSCVAHNQTLLCSFWQAIRTTHSPSSSIIDCILPSVGHHHQRSYPRRLFHKFLLLYAVSARISFETRSIRESRSQNLHPCKPCFFRLLISSRALICFHCLHSERASVRPDCQ